MVAGHNVRIQLEAFDGGLCPSHLAHVLLASPLVRPALGSFVTPTAAIPFLRPPLPFGGMVRWGWGYVSIPHPRPIVVVVAAGAGIPVLVTARAGVPALITTDAGTLVPQVLRAIAVDAGPMGLEVVINGN